MSSGGDDYQPLYLAWRLLRPGHAPREEEKAAEGGTVASEAPPLRHRVQRARVARRWKVEELAARMQCDEATLAAFERGDEVLSGELQQRAKRVLQL